MSKRKNGILFGLCALAAALLLLLCSQCSPLYPLNIWGDANCLLTVGRVMREGGVLYRDIYEQKGPTLYLIHEIAACISDSSFLGVYVLEVISLAAALFAACRLLMLRMRAEAAFPAAVLVCACLLTGAAFSRGDSAEEFCLPYLMAALYIAFEAYGQKDGPMRAGRLFVCGLLAGVVATIKFTILGLFVGLCLVEGVLALREGGVCRALRSALAFLAGMLLPVVCWCAYFALHGALGDFYTAYIYNNIFLYSDEARTLMDAARDVWDAVRGNALWALAATAGMLALLLDRRERLQLKLAVLAMAACAFASVFLLGRTWPYSPLVLGVFAFAGQPALYARLAKGERSPSVLRAGGACSCALALAAALLLSPNAYLRGVPLEELAQARLAAYIEEDATLLQYSHLDDGLYLLSGALPQERFFVNLNVNYEWMRSELDRYVAEAIPDYVLVSWRELPDPQGNYQLIAQDTAYDDSNRLNKMLYLYRRK